MRNVTQVESAGRGVGRGVWEGKQSQSAVLDNQEGDPGGASLGKSW